MRYAVALILVPDTLGLLWESPRPAQCKLLRSRTRTVGFGGAQTHLNVTGFSSSLAVDDVISRLS